MSWEMVHRSINPRELVVAVLRGRDLTARQLVKDAARASFSWTEAPPPDFRGPRARAVYAGLVELFASRQGKSPPEWTRDVPPAPKSVVLLALARKCKVALRMVERDTPVPLKSRNVLATRQYLDVL